MLPGAREACLQVPPGFYLYGAPAAKRAEPPGLTGGGATGPGDGHSDQQQCRVLCYVLLGTGTTAPILPPLLIGRAFQIAQRDVRQDLVTATAASSIIACFIMGAAANMPLALAPGMGLNAYFAYNVVGYRGTGNVSRHLRLAGRWGLTSWSWSPSGAICKPGR